VLVPFTTSCGACPPCRHRALSPARHGALFGYGSPQDPHAPALQGGQAELVRVPLADGTLVRVPPGVSDREAVLLTDNLPTGWWAAERADIVAGDTVAVVGLGSVGLCAVVGARALGAGRVLAVDPVRHRRDGAAQLGAVAVHPDDAADALEALDAEGAPAAVDAAGTATAQSLAASLVRPGGTLSVIAVQTADRFGFTPVEAYDGNLTVRVGRAPVRSVLDRLLPLLARGRVTVPGDVVLTHPDVPLADGPDIYRRFATREPGMVKAAFAP
jgi:alcohol dehydrogenase